MDESVNAVIVTYNPDLDVLNANIASVLSQTDSVFIVDNGSSSVNWDDIRLDGKIQIVRLEENFGIGYAQNIGMKLSVSKKAEWTVILDQDTVLPANYVTDVLDRISGLPDVGIASGRFIDRNQNDFEMLNCPSDVEVVNDIIASGNIVKNDAWSIVGGFNEELFIDYVDFEFDYRLISKGFKIYLINAVTFDHAIGDSVKNTPLMSFLLLKGRYIFDHSPMRMYYMNRNRLVVRSKYPEYGSPINMLIREILNLREIFLFNSPRTQKIYWAVRGILSGTRYMITGKLKDEFRKKI